jgi:acetylornithine deacetylase/succinyl-diaminopimelate desuccinylase-like protein
MRWLVENHAEEINPEWVWDEGSGGLKGVFGKKVMFAVAVAEKQIYRVRLIATGEPGHGSMPHHNSANLTLIAALQRIADTPRPMHVDAAAKAMFRALAETQTFPASFFLRNLSCRPALFLAGGKLAADKFTNAALRDTVCINVINGGYQINVIPEQAEAQLDCRLLPGTDAAEFGRWLNERIADDRIKVEMIRSSPPSGIAPLTGSFYQTVCQVVADHHPGAGVFPLLMTGATDGRYWRMSGYAAYGFAPIILERGDVNRVHGIDERISVDNLLSGISMTQDIIRRLCA